MKKLLPEIEPPITCLDCHERLLYIRNVIYDAMEPEYVNPLLNLKETGLFDLQKQFESDKDLRVSTARVVIASILWVEASQLPQEIVQNCEPEIKSQIVYTVHLFLSWIALKSAVQKEEAMELGSMATAWIYLFEEFSRDLENYSQDLWWKPKPTPYSSACS